MDEPSNGQQRRFARDRLARLLREGFDRSNAATDDERLLDAVVYVVRRSQPDAVDLW